MSVKDVWSMLTEFVSENFYYIANDVLFPLCPGSFEQCTSKVSHESFSKALLASEIFNPQNAVTLFPIIPASIESGFDSPPFFLVEPQKLVEFFPSDVDTSFVIPNQFPPLKDFNGKIEFPNAWLGVRSPTEQASKRMRAAILGALALTQKSQRRYRFSGRNMFGGQCTIKDQTASFSFGDAHTPPLMDDITITNSDHAWLQLLASKFTNPTDDHRKQINALRYFYRSWPLDSDERFPILFMSLDAIYGQANQHTKTIIAALSAVAGKAFTDERLEKLLKMRAASIHGGAPDVHDSSKYQQYYEAYGEDPINDLEIVAATCLRLAIFGTTMVEHVPLITPAAFKQ